mgnify:CR=1 FL=1
MRGICGPGPEDVRKIDILGRTIEWREGGIEYRSDPKLARILIEDLVQDVDSKGKDVPGEKDDISDDDDEILGQARRASSARSRRAPTTCGWT